jgi:hypothetical protein
LIDGAREEGPVVFIDQNTVGKRKILRKKWHGKKTWENSKREFEIELWSYYSMVSRNPNCQHPVKNFYDGFASSTELRRTAVLLPASAPWVFRRLAYYPLYFRLDDDSDVL